VQRTQKTTQKRGHLEVSSLIQYLLSLKRIAYAFFFLAITTMIKATMAHCLINDRTFPKASGKQHLARGADIFDKF
jgi:hypothetical protein